MTDDRQELMEYFEHALRELFSLEELLAGYGQHQMADVLHSVVEMAYGKLYDLGVVLDRDIGGIEIQFDEFGKPLKAVLSAKPKNESLH